MGQRELAVAGQFYPKEKSEVLRYIDHFDKVLSSNGITIKQDDKTKAIIVPHAGYIYSGFSANCGYKTIPNGVKNIIVIGPSHKFRFSGASVALYDLYPTPLGSLTIDKELSKNLIERFEFLTFDDKVHCEHSTEVQFPFIKHYMADVKVVEIVYSDIKPDDIKEVIKYLLKDKDNFVVISTDLSHFYDLQTANKLDSICISAIVKQDMELFDRGCEACGMIGVKAITAYAKEHNLKGDILDYRTSADISGDKNRVVGYLSVGFG